MTSPIASAVHAYDAAIAAAEDQYQRDVRAATARRDEALEHARKACQEVLDASAAEGIAMTVSYAPRAIDGGVKP